MMTVNKMSLHWQVIRMKRIKISKDTKLYFGIGAAVGFVLFLIVYGFRVLDFTYDGWLLTGKDLQQHYLGWKFFRKSPWTFPLGMHDSFTVPDSVSVLYTDSIPLFALFFKLLSPILPETFQYFGLFGLMCYILNGGRFFSGCTAYCPRIQDILRWQRIFLFWVPLRSGFIKINL